MDKYLIAPINKGLKLDVVPFMAPEDAFQTLTNMYIKDGSIIKKQIKVLQNSNNYGATCRLRHLLGNTDGVGNFTGIVPGAPTTSDAGQQFMIGTILYTSYQTTGALYVSSGTSTATFNTNTGAVAFTGAAATTAVYWYPSFPVKAFANYNFSQETLAFDNYYAYEYVTGGSPGWERIVGTVWSTSADRYYSTENFQGAVSGDAVLFVANNFDPIRYYDGITFTNFYPAFRSVANYNVRRCKIVKDFASRLLLLYTYEYEGALVEVEHANRIRFSTYGDCFSTDAWYQPPDTNNKGSYIDLPVGKKIVCCGELNNNLIIFCEDSIYKLIPTGNFAFPFQLVLVEENYGVDLQNVIELNDNLIFANNFGKFATDGNNIKKIDHNISPLENSLEFIQGTIYKELRSELIYITYNSKLSNVFPNRFYMYNYINNTWSIGVDTFTTIGTITKSEDGTPLVRETAVVGNTQGYIHNLTNLYKNSFSLFILNIDRIDATYIRIFVRRHNLDEDQFITISESNLVDLNGSYKIEEVIDSNTLKITNLTVNVANYVGDAVIAIIDQIYIRTKEFNFYMKSGYASIINKVAFNVNRTTNNGEYLIGLLPNGSSIGASETVPASTIGTNVLETKAYTTFDDLETTQNRLWHHTYITERGDSISLNLQQTDDQLLDDTIPYQELTINAIMLYVSPSDEI